LLPERHVSNAAAGFGAISAWEVTGALRKVVVRDSSW
jgi:hypothetical protein